jgi:hypothetical protein
MHTAPSTTARGLAALLFFMSFSYNLGSNPAIDYPRLLISDTQPVNHIFEDEEINAMYVIVNSNFQSGMFYSGTGGTNPASTPVSYLRVAAYLLVSVAANKSRLASIKQLLDVKLDSSDAAIQMRDTAEQYLDMDDNAGAFMIIEQCNDDFSFRDRFWKTVQRSSSV